MRFSLDFIYFVSGFNCGKKNDAIQLIKLETFFSLFFFFIFNLQRLSSWWHSWIFPFTIVYNSFANFFYSTIVWRMKWLCCVHHVKFFKYTVLTLFSKKKKKWKVGEWLPFMFINHRCEYYFFFFGELMSSNSYLHFESQVFKIK